MPLQRRVPKVGFKPINRVEYVGVNLDVLQGLAEKFNLVTIDFTTLQEHGLAHKNDLVKVLGRGEVKSKIEVKAHAFSATAQKAIEAVGGSIEKL
jgi:large subunit ribosomal protein L15